MTDVKVNASSELNANLALSQYDFPGRYRTLTFSFFSVKLIKKIEKSKANPKGQRELTSRESMWATGTLCTVHCAKRNGTGKDATRLDTSRDVTQAKKSSY